MLYVVVGRINMKSVNIYRFTMDLSPEQQFESSAANFGLDVSWQGSSLILMDGRGKGVLKYNQASRSRKFPGFLWTDCKANWFCVELADFDLIWNLLLL